jgi:hypothetical protein
MESHHHTEGATTMARKTVDVAKVLRMANHALAIDISSIGATPEEAFRIGVATILEGVLHESDNYHGYAYLDIRFENDGTSNVDSIDQTRRRYMGQEA